MKVPSTGVTITSQTARNFTFGRKGVYCQTVTIQPSIPQEMTNTLLPWIHVIYLSASNCKKHMFRI